MCSEQNKKFFSKSFNKIIETYILSILYVNFHANVGRMKLKHRNNKDMGKSCEARQQSLFLYY